MPDEFQLGSRGTANDLRDRISEFLADDDDRRSATISLDSAAPTSIRERLGGETVATQSSDRDGFGREKLTETERKTLKRTTGFEWQQHGFEAMAAKAALQAKGVTDWTNYYEPGEGVESSLGKLRQGKQMAAQTGAPAAIGGDYTDEEDIGNAGRRAKQSEQAQAGRVRSAKRPALVDLDTGARGFLQEEQRFTDDLFDISFTETDPFGRPEATGRDADLLRDRHEQRSDRAQTLDEQKQAPVTRDPLEWSANVDEFDFPGIDTLDPEQKHNARSKKAKQVDESRSAPLASSPTEWANDMDSLDLPGVDAPKDAGSGGPSPTSSGIGTGFDSEPADSLPKTSGAETGSRDAFAELDDAMAGRNEALGDVEKDLDDLGSLDF